MIVRSTLLVILLLTACSPAIESTLSPTHMVDSTPAQGETPQMPPQAFTPPSGLDALIEKAKEDLSKRLSTASSLITVVEARDVVWPNASLGCPQPDMVYADVLTPGYLILLQADQQTYEYHAGRGPDVLYCEDPSPPVPGMSGDV